MSPDDVLAEILTAARVVAGILPSDDRERRIRLLEGQNLAMLLLSLDAMAVDGSLPMRWLRQKHGNQRNREEREKRDWVARKGAL